MKIEKGCTRTVFVFKNYVIKIPTFLSYSLFLNGLLANMQEGEFSKIERDDLGKVYYYNKFGLFLIMKKYYIVDNNCNAEKLLSFLEDKYKDDDMRSFMLRDFKPSNWGVYKNKFVKIDYGN